MSSSVLGSWSLSSALRRLTAVAVVYVAAAFVPPAPFDGPLFLLKLFTAPAPTNVALPVDGVRPKDLRDSWGNARSGGRRHEGIDIFAPRGTRVLASTIGIVARTNTDPLGGLVVWVLGPGGQRHYYAHLDRRSTLRTGDRVNVGDTLGYVGTTGNARGGAPHLHYGIYADGGAIDPYPLLVARPGEASAAANDPPKPAMRKGARS